MKRGLRSLSARLTLSASLLSTAAANAAGISVEAAPLLGNVAPESGAFRTLRVRISNDETTPLSGFVELKSEIGWSRSAAEVTARAAFAVPPKSQVSLLLTSRDSGNYPGTGSTVTVRSAKDEELASTTLSAGRPADVLLFDLAAPSRLSGSLKNTAFVSQHVGRYSTNRVCNVAAVGATEDPKSGDLLLPDRAAGYSGATLVLANGRDLTRLRDTERVALADWLLGGGALALVLDRPEDLRQGLVEALLGGPITRAPAPTALLEPSTFLVPPEDVESINSQTPLKWLRLKPTAELAQRFVGVAGGNLRPSPWGAAASYGLGEVHVLAFDPREDIAQRDPWAAQQLTDLLRHTFDRGPQAAITNTWRMPGEGNANSVRRELDPNRTSRWTIVVSALVLLIYALLAGPLNFRLAAKRGQPLRALLRLPLASLLTLGIIAGLGVLSKGLSGRARRLAFYEAGAGMTRARAVRFRGFYAASAYDLAVRASRREFVLDLAGTQADSSRQLVIDRDGPRLEGLRTKPWQTVLVREDGMADLSGGVSIVAQQREFLLHNRAARDLVGVVARAPGGDTRYFPRIKEGASVTFSSGRALGTISASNPLSPVSTPLNVDRFSTQLDRDFPGLSRTWYAMEQTFASETDWWPDDVPVVIAALDGGEGTLSDSGLKVDYDRALIRVVGLGGKP